MRDRTPRYRYHFYPSTPGSDGAGLTIGIRRVDGDPDGGPFLQRTSSQGIDLDLVLADLREILGSLPAADEWHGPRPEPLRRWAFEGINGPFVMRLTKPCRHIGEGETEEKP